jgi:type VI secretion system secreted protein Hcp
MSLRAENAYRRGASTTYIRLMATDIFAKIGDIKGESQDAKHKDEIEVLSFSWGVSSSESISTGAAGGAGAGKATFKDLTIVHVVDKASPLLLKACATGTHLKDATITHRKAGKGQQEFLVVKMNDIIITSVSHGGSADQSSAETVSMAFAKVDLEYFPQKADGSLDAAVAFKYDLKANKIG